MELKNMKLAQSILIMIIVLIVFILTSCSRLTLKPADFAWPLESVLKVNNKGFVSEERYAVSFDTKNLFLKETEDSSAYRDKEVRLIRDVKGYYYLTASNFKNVYVFANDEDELCLEEKIEVSQTGIANPAFNQRAPYVELVDGDKKILLNNDGIKEDEDENEK